MQRSSYGQFYYFRYGCIINKLPLQSGTFFHTFGKIDISTPTYQEIQKILDLENNLSDEERETLLNYYLKKIVPKVNPIETEKDLKDYLIKIQLPISADVMKHLKLRCVNNIYSDEWRIKIRGRLEEIGDGSMEFGDGSEWSTFK